MPVIGRYLDEKWLKRYAIGGLIWLVLGGVVDGYKYPGQDMLWGAIVVVAAAWPVVTAVIAGSAVGKVASDIRLGKLDLNGREPA